MMISITEQHNKKFKPMKLLESFLLACIINMNIMRFIFSVYDTSFLLYGIYLIFVVIGIVNHNLLHDIKLNLLRVCVLLLLFVAIFTSFFVGGDAINSAVKFVISVIIAYISFYMSYKQILQTIKFIVIFNIIYCIVILISPENAFEYMNVSDNGTNYLTMTLTVGLLATISLAYFIYLIFTKIHWIKLCSALVVCFIAFVMMLKFAARGAILLPILASVIIYIILAVKHKRRFFKATMILILVAIMAFRIYSNVANPFLVKRMMSLFENTGGEERLEIWTMYLNLVLNNLLFILGGGTNSAIKLTEYYPHNIYLQLFGEFGLLGMFVAIAFTVKIASNILKCNNIYATEKVANMKHVYYLVLGAFLYYFLTFMKSFTLYDACPLFVFCAFLFRMEILLNTHVQQSCKLQKCTQYKQRRERIHG